MRTEESASTEEVDTGSSEAPTGTLVFGRPVFDGLSRLDVFGVALLGLVTVALLPGFFQTMNIRQAIVIAGIPTGVWLLGRRAMIGHDRAAIAGVAFLAITLLSALRSEARGVAVFGATGHELSMVMLAGGFGWWAIGREFTAAGRRALPVVLTATAGLNVVIGLYQIALNPTSGIYFAYGGRLSGLMANPVYFASTFVGVWAYWFVCALRKASRVHLFLAGALALAVSLSGSRGAVAVGLSVVVVGVVVRPRRSAVVASVLTVVGFATGFVVLAVLTSSQSDRLGTASNASSGIRQRVEVWEVAIRMWADRPWVGWGPDPYLYELNSRLPARTAAGFSRVVWTDPHNVVIFVLLISGLFGALALALFVIAGLRGRVDVALLAASAAIVLSWLLQPVMSNGWPIAFALFGAAVRPVAKAIDETSASRTGVLTGLVAIGTVIGLIYMSWSLSLGAAVRERDPDLIDERAWWLIDDADVATVAARFYKNSDATGRQLELHFARAEELATRAVDRGRHQNAWGLLTEIQLIRGDPAAALESAQGWVAAWPNDPVATRFLRTTATVAGDSETAAAAADRLCELIGDCSSDGSSG